MHTRDWREQALGEWCVEVFLAEDLAEQERFYSEKDAREYQKELEANGLNSVLLVDKNKD
jgi:hypothetical protein